MTTRLFALNASRLSLTVAVLCLSASPAFAQTAASRTGAVQPTQSSGAQSSAAPTDTPARGRVDPCSAAWIEAAAKQRVAPNVVGCNIKDVTLPLVRVGVLPSPSKHDGKEPAGQIVAQTPEAGAPLKRGGTLAMQVSTGRVPQPAQEAPAPATSAAPETPAETPPEKPPETVPASAAPAEPKPDTAPAPMSEAASETAQPAAPNTDSKPKIPELATPTGLVAFRGVKILLLIGLGILAALGVVALAKGGGKSGRKSARGLPHVTCEAEFGPGRLVRRGPLVLGEKGSG